MADAGGITPEQLHWVIGFFEKEEETTPSDPQHIVDAIVDIFLAQPEDWDACQMTEDIWALLNQHHQIYPTPEEE